MKKRSSYKRRQTKKNLLAFHKFRLVSSKIIRDTNLDTQQSRNSRYVETSDLLSYL